MEFAGDYQGQSTTSAAPVQFPWYVWIIVGVLASVSIVIMSLSVVTQHEITNPFSAFTNLFADDAWQAALAHGFTCQDSESGSYSQAALHYCTQRDANGIFSGIELQISSNFADEISFSPRGNALRLGDLVLLWGEVEILRYCGTTVAYWPTRRIRSILGTPRTGSISYFSPARIITFTHSQSPVWERLLMNDENYHC